MTPREIIAKAWAMTKNETQLRRWGFASALLETLLSVKLLVYQAWFAYSYFVAGEPVGFFIIEETLFQYFPFTVALTIVIFIVVLIAIELIFPHFATGAIIGLAAKSHLKQEVKGGFVLALYNFFPIFVLHELFVLSGVSTVITIASFVLRYGPGAEFNIFILAILGFFFVFSIIFKFLASFAEESVVIHKNGTFNAIGRSFKIIISHLGHMVFLLILLLVIMLRIVINVIMLLLIPGIVIGIALLLAQFLPPVISYSIGSIVGLALVGVASYFFAYLTVFRQTVWTITYIELSAQKDLDIIEDTNGSSEKIVSPVVERENPAV